MKYLERFDILFVLVDYSVLYMIELFNWNDMENIVLLNCE